MNAKIKRLFVLLAAVVLAVVTIIAPAKFVYAAEADTITILHTNDVHCAIDEYDKVAAYKKSVKNPVVLVDAGDHAQGEIIGTITEGKKIIELMNATGYDLAVPGNHEFDYKVPAFLAMVDSANFPYVSANFAKADGSKIDGIEPYKILTVGDHKIAFVGITTPETYTKSTPVYFQDGNGNWVYTFNENSLMEKVQAAVDAAKAEGAELVVVVAHTGIDGTDDRWAADKIIAETNGIDVYIDAHSHEVAENKTFKNKDGKDVPYQQTGTKLANIGQIDITFGETVEFNLHLVEVKKLTEEDAEVSALIKAANAEVDNYYNQVIGHTDFLLTTKQADGKTRQVRKGETNMGDFNADAYRIIGGADITLMNGGGVRADVPAGDITRKALTSVNPWMNAVVKVEVKGSVILDALEHGARNYPNENGGFFQVSGLTYKIDPSVESSVVTDDQGMFVKVDGEYRVYDVMVGDAPLDPEKTYTVITTEYILLESGDGMAMFNGNVKVIEEYDDPDSEFLVKYLVDYLKGKVPEEYKDIAGQGRIVVQAKPGKDTITILHTNDVHCGIDGYPQVASYKKGLENPVVLVDAGDHAQGEIIGTITEGQKIIELMNASGYDLAVPGNHEFDYKMPAFLEMVKNAKYPYVSANFTKADGTRIEGIDAYKILTIGEHKIAFVGITTPETYTKSTPKYFQDENGNWVYTFNETKLAEVVQKNVDAARAAGAELVVVVAHTGIDGTDDRWAADKIIAETNGIDVYIDAHSHEVAENKTFKNKDGKDVPYQQTGTKLEYIGQIDITFTGTKAVYNLHLVKVEKLTEKDAAVQKIVDEAKAEVDAYYGQVVGHSNFPLTIKNAGGTREVRKGETNLGDFNADAYRLIGEADITLMNGGGVRADVIPDEKTGNITRAQLTAVNPWMNAVVKVEATGQQILDALEHGARNYPKENGGFFQVSGITYKIDPSVESSVVTDDQGMFVKVDGEYRVFDVMVGGEPLDVKKTYTVITTEYILLESGDGMTMFEGVKILEQYDDPDSEFLVKYLRDYLKGEVPEEYKDIAGQGRIVFEEKPDVVYTVVSGADAAWYKGSEKGVEIVVKRNVDDHMTFGLFVGIEVEGKELAAENYKAEAGSLVAEISPEYLKSLEDGKYNVKVIFEDGEAVTSFSVSSTPPTGDHSQIGLYTMLLGATLAAAIYVFKRKEEE